MWNNLSLRQKLLSLVSAVIIVFAGVAALNIILLVKSSAAVTQADQYTQVKTDLLDNAQTHIDKLLLAQQRLLATLPVLITRQAKATDTVTALSDDISSEATLIQTIGKSFKTPLKDAVVESAKSEVSALAAELEPLHARNKSEIAEIINLAKNGKATDSQKLVDTKLEPRLAQISSIIDAHETKMDAIATELTAKRVATLTKFKQLQKQANLLLISGIVAGGCVGLALAWRLGSKEAISARKLRDNMILALPDDVEKPNIIKKDEIEQLSEVFALLTNKFKDYAVVVERRNELEDLAERSSSQTNVSEQTKAAMLNLLEDAKNLELKLEVERDRANAIVSSLAEGVLVVDQRQIITSLNPAGEQLLGLQAIGVVGKPTDTAYQIINGTYLLRTEDQPLFKTLREGKIVSYGIESQLYFHTALGKRFPAAITTAPLISGGKVTGAIVAFRDITRERQAQQVIENRPQNLE